VLTDSHFRYINISSGNGCFYLLLHCQLERSYGRLVQFVEVVSFFWIHYHAAEVDLSRSKLTKLHHT